MRKLGLVLLVITIAIAAVVLVRAALVRSHQIAVAPAPAVAVDPNAVARLSRAVQFKTVSYSDEQLGDHDAFVEWLPSAYPRVHAAMQRELVNGHSLLFTWSGSDPLLPPLLMMGHYDVVPVEDESKWSVPPFSGMVRDGFVWGRGTMDDKMTVIGVLEAAEMLIREGWRPKRTILFAFGHDEERGGEHGAQQVARLLASRGVKLDTVVDEGGAITVGMAPGVAGPVAMIGTAEKGFISVGLSATAAGGHSSMPPRDTAVSLVAAAVERVEHHPLPSHIARSTRAMFDTLAPEMKFGLRVVATNLWLTKPLLDFRARKSDSLRAMLHTTTAATMIGGGVKDNVLPTEAHAVVNFRILPGETPDSVLAHVRRVVADPRVKVSVFGEHPSTPSRESNPSSPEFHTLERTIRQVYPGTIVTPYLVVGATDARYYTPLSANVYRFTPGRVRESDLERIHGIDERIGVNDFLDCVRFYRLFLRNAAG